MCCDCASLGSKLQSKQKMEIVGVQCCVPLPKIHNFLGCKKANYKNITPSKIGSIAMEEEHRLHISNFPFWFGRKDIAFALGERFARPSRITPLRVGPYDVRFRRMSAFVHWNNEHGFPPPELVTGWLPQAMWNSGWTVPLVAQHVRPPAPKGQGKGKTKG